MSDRIKRCLLGAKYTDEITELKALGIEVIPLPESPYLDEEINGHADILSFRLDDALLFLDSSIAGETAPLLKPYNIIKVESIASPYPNDAKLNVAVLGNKIICNRAYVCDTVIQKACNKYELINTRQGYTKCNLCVINNNAVITEDAGLSSLLKNYQIDVLKLDAGYVHLSDKHYGFIGGASARISDGEIYFSGDISSHPQYNEIISFLNKYNFKAIFNVNRPLIDFGGIVSI